MLPTWPRLDMEGTWQRLHSPRCLSGLIEKSVGDLDALALMDGPTLSTSTRCDREVVCLLEPGTLNPPSHLFCPAAQDHMRDTPHLPLL